MHILKRSSLFSQLCDTQDEVNQTLASGALDSGIQVSLSFSPNVFSKLCEFPR